MDFIQYTTHNTIAYVLYIYCVYLILIQYINNTYIYGNDATTGYVYIAIYYLLFTIYYLLLYTIYSAVCKNTTLIIILHEWIIIQHQLHTKLKTTFQRRHHMLIQIIDRLHFTVLFALRSITFWKHQKSRSHDPGRYYYSIE